LSFELLARFLGTALQVLLQAALSRSIVASNKLTSPRGNLTHLQRVSIDKLSQSCAAQKSEKRMAAYSA
jgi:hypothetical protein